MIGTGSAAPSGYPSIESPQFQAAGFTKEISASPAVTRVTARARASKTVALAGEHSSRVKLPACSSVGPCRPARGPLNAAFFSRTS